MKQPIDSLIFDMDGTLWDAVSSYCAVWNAAIEAFGIDRPKVSYDELINLMGFSLNDIYAQLIGDKCAEPEKFAALIKQNQLGLLPKLGGELYEGVRDTLKSLHSRGYKLFMVSNCLAEGIDIFLNFTHLSEFFTDTLTHGATGVDKDVNIRRLVDTYNLKRAVYVGDIQGDADSTHAAGIEFIWAAYGFGKVSDAEFQINTFSELETKVLNNGN